MREEKANTKMHKRKVLWMGILILFIALIASAAFYGGWKLMENHKQALLETERMNRLMNGSIDRIVIRYTRKDDISVIIDINLKDQTKEVTIFGEEETTNTYSFTKGKELEEFIKERILPSGTESGVESRVKGIETDELRVLWDITVYGDEDKLMLSGFDEYGGYPEYWEDLLKLIEVPE